MSLKSFHILFISLSAVMAAALTGWGLRDFRDSGEGLSLALAVVGLLIFALLIPYTVWFRRKMSRLPSAILLALLVPQAAEACAVCFGDPNSPLVHGAKMGVLALGGVVSFVLGGILVVALSWARRAHRSSE